MLAGAAGLKKKGREADLLDSMRTLHDIWN